MIEPLYRPMPSRKLLIGQLCWSVGWLAITGIGLWLKPDPLGHGTHQQLGLPPCPSALFFSRPCPGCGLTTSWTALLHGQIGFAFHAHPFGPLLYLLFTLTAWGALIGFVKQARFEWDQPMGNTLTTWTFVVVLIFGAIRMAVTPNYGSPVENVMRQAALGHPIATTK